MKSFFLNNIVRYLSIVFIGIVFSLGLMAKDSYANDINITRAFAGFIKHIYLNVSTSGNGSDFCVVGSDDISIQIKAIFKNDKYKDLGSEVREGSDYSECRVIYIARSKEKESKYIAQFFVDKGALTIGSFSNFVSDGGMMNIGIGRRNFELTVNELMIKNSGVKVDSSIVALIVR